MSKVYAKYYHKRVHSWNKAEQKIRITGFSFLRTFGNNFPAHSLRRQGQEASFLNCALLAGIFNHLPVKEERASLTRGGNKAGDMELTRDLLKIDPAKGTDQMEHGEGEGGQTLGVTLAQFERAWRDIEWKREATVSLRHLPPIPSLNFNGHGEDKGFGTAE